LKLEDAEYYSKLRELGLLRANDFSIHHMADEYLKLYNIIING
jgi:hypothetical protein